MTGIRGGSANRRRPRSGQPVVAPARRRRGVLEPTRALLAVAVGVLALGCAVMATLVATGKFGNSTQYLPITSCQAGSPGCVARGPANLHADFAMFIDGTQVDFTQSQFAAVAGADANFDANGKTIAVHKQLTTWDSFLRSAHMELNDPTLPGGTVADTCLTMPDGKKYCTTKTDTFKFFVNGVQVDGIVNTEIDDLDRVLVSYGPETVAQVKAAQLPKLTALSCQADGRCAGGSGG